jgi:hypothetical protein
MTTTSMSPLSFEKTASMFVPDMKGLHVIEFVTNDQPYPAEKVRILNFFFLGLLFAASTNAVTNISLLFSSFFAHSLAN